MIINSLLTHCNVCILDIAAKYILSPVYYIVTGCMGEYWTAGWKPYTSKPANPSVHIYTYTYR